MGCGGESGAHRRLVMLRMPGAKWLQPMQQKSVQDVPEERPACQPHQSEGRQYRQLRARSRRQQPDRGGRYGKTIEDEVGDICRLALFQIEKTHVFPSPNCWYNRTTIIMTILFRKFSVRGFMRYRPAVPAVVA